MKKKTLQEYLEEKACLEETIVLLMADYLEERLTKIEERLAVLEEPIESRITQSDACEQMLHVAEREVQDLVARGIVTFRDEK